MRGIRWTSTLHGLFLTFVAGLVSATGLAQSTPCDCSARRQTPPTPTEQQVIARIVRGDDLKGEKIEAQLLEKLLIGGFKGVRFAHDAVEIKNAVFDEPLRLRNQAIPLELHLTNCHFRRGLDFSMSHFLELYMDHSVFDSASEVNFNGMRVDANLYLTHAEFSGMPTFYHLDVGDDLHAEDAKFNGQPVECDEGNDDHYVASPDRCNIMFDQSEVRGKLFLDGSQFRESLSLADVAVQGLHLEKVSVRKDLKLSHARVETVIEIDLSGEPRWVLLEGLTYHDLGGSSVGDKLRHLIEERSPYFSSQSYSQLEDYYRTHGAQEKADAVFIDMKRKERGPFTWRGSQSWLSSWLLDRLVGYGRYPGQALIPSACFVLAGSLVFWLGQRHMVPKKPNETERKYNELWYALDPFWYSLDLFAPVIDLDAASVWTPTPEWKIGWYYARFQRIIGWILVPIIVAALTGIIK